MNKPVSPEQCTAIILAGGEARRMGRDKSRLFIGNTSLLSHAMTQVQAVFPHYAVSVRQLRPDLPCPQWCDEHDQRGPMVGIATALSRMTTPWLFVLACDMPFVSSSMIRQLLVFAGQQQADVIVPRIDGYLQPLCALYAAACLPPMEASLAQEQRSLWRLIESLNHRVMHGTTDAQRWMDIDTPEDLCTAKHYWRQKEFLS